MNTSVIDSSACMGADSKSKLPFALAALALTVGAVCTPAGAAVLYSQLNNPAAGGNVSTQNFEPGFSGYDAMGADDFVVAGSGWKVDQVQLDISIASALVPQTTANIRFYANNGNKPGALLGSFLAAPFAAGMASLVGGIDLMPGTYWVGVDFDRSYAVGGQVFWNTRATQSGFAGVWQNPAGGFGTGCTTWSTLNACGVGGTASRDYLFALSGSSLTNNVPEPATMALVLAALGGISLTRRRRA
jgi:PEP-CTERM motif